MKKLIIAVLVSSFVFGMVGMAGAAYVEDFTLTGQNFKLKNGDTATINFDLSALSNTAIVKANTKLPSPDENTYSLANILDSALLDLSFTTNNLKTDTGLLTIKIIDGSFDYVIYNGAVTPTYSMNLEQITLQNDDIINYISDGRFSTVISVSGMEKAVNNGGNPALSISNAMLTVDAHAVPLPAAGLLLGSGLIGLIGARRKMSV